MNPRAGLPKAFTFISFLLILLASVACGSDQEMEAGPDLDGYWAIEQTLRNGRPTESAADLYFRFGPDDKLVTNVSSSQESGTFTREENTIVTDGISLLTTYDIVELTDEKLVLRSAVGNYRFEFLLRRAADETGNTTS